MDVFRVVSAVISTKVSKAWFAIVWTSVDAGVSVRACVAWDRVALSEDGKLPRGGLVTACGFVVVLGEEHVSAPERMLDEDLNAEQ